MPAPRAAALAPLGQGYRGEHEVPGRGVGVAGLTRGDGAVVRISDRVVALAHTGFRPTTA